MMTLHSRRVLHRDLKPDNILLDSNYRPSITDFGLSKILDNSSSKSFNPCGTMAYMAPEIFDGNHYSTKSDVYSFGILMFEVLTGEKAFGKQIDKKSFIAFGNEVCQGKRPVFKTPIKQSFKQLIEQCWSANPRQRPTFRDLYHKLSLILDDEDETVKESSNPVHNEEEENEEENVNDEYGYFRYFLDEVDVDKVLDYFEELSEVQPLKITEHDKQIDIFKQEINSMKQHYQGEIEKQTNHIKELQQEIDILKHKYQQEVEKQTKCNNELKEENHSIEETHQNELQFITNKLEETRKQFQSIDFCQEEITSLKNAVTELQKFIFISDDAFLKDLKSKIQDFKSTQITIPSSVTSIGNSAFSDCSSLTQITIPSSVTSIGENAFSNCSSLTQITIPSSVTSIGDSAFSNCSSLTQITIPSSVTFGHRPFLNCHNLTQIIILTNLQDSTNSYCRVGFFVKSILDDNLFHQSQISQNNIFSYAKSIAHLLKQECQNAQIIFSIPIQYINSKFGYHTSLTQITIPSSVTSIGNNAFSNCSSLTQITIPSSVKSIGNNTFSYCSKLTQITIPSSVTSIGPGAFYTCSSLTQITIPSSVTSIGNNTFSYCSKLTQITIPSSVTSIENGAFSGCTSLTQIIIPSSVTSIGNNAFSNCSTLTQITIPSSVTSIGNNAFYNCSSLTQIIIPSSVTSIGNNAFSYCSSLTQITIPSSVASIGNKAFYGCSNLNSALRKQLQMRFEKVDGYTYIIQYNPFDQIIGSTCD